MAHIDADLFYERGWPMVTRIRSFRTTSYYLHMVSAGTEVRINRQGISGSPIFIGGRPYQRGRGRYASGRFDATHQGIAELRYHMSAAATVMLSFQYGKRTSTNALRGLSGLDSFYRRPISFLIVRVRAAALKLVPG